MHSVPEPCLCVLASSNHSLLKTAPSTREAAVLERWNFLFSFLFSRDVCVEASWIVVSSFHVCKSARSRRHASLKFF